MERGLYAAATGMIAQQRVQETLAQNLANANTVGYKQDIPTFKAVHGMALQRITDGHGRGSAVGEVGMGVAEDKTYTDWQSGPVATTGNALDASLDPGQFFAVQSPNGVRYTRAGNFQLDAGGNLITAGGLKVLGTDNNPIKVTGSIAPKLDTTGNVTLNGKPIARLQVVQAAKNALSKEGDTLFAPAGAGGIQPAAQPGVHPGALEQSNVNVVSGMVRLITVSRGFEMAQRAIVTQDEMLRHAANDLGHV